MSVVPSDSTRAFLEKSSQRYHEQLSPSAVEYLTGPERGLTEEVIEKFRLGFVGDPEPGHETYAGMLAIPYLTPKGSVVSIRFRSLPPADKVYLTVAGDTPRPYNTVDIDRGTSSICVTEGEFDCAVSTMCGLPTAGLPGSNSWNPVWVRLFQPYDAVYLLSDDDESGRRMAEKLGSVLPNLRNVPMVCSEPKGDVTKFYLEFGEQELRKKVGIK